MAKNKTRPLWLQIKFDAPGAYPNQVKKTLLQSIRHGDYVYPSKWRVALGWSNKPDGELRWGEFTREMLASRESSPGFDAAVASYLENQL